MNNAFGNLVIQFREFIKGLTPVKRASVFSAAVIILVSTVVVIIMITGTSYKKLLGDVPPDQLATIVQKLEQHNVPFKLEDNGATIMVPVNLLSSTQMVVMSELGPSKIGSIGLESFDKQDFGVTSYAQRVQYQRALQGELQRAINTLDSVKRSKVILALPPKKTFLEESAKPTASVVLELHAGKILNDEQIRGITFLVASGVEGLDSENVTVVDARGKVLSRNTNLAAQASGELFDVQKKIEASLEDRIESILSKVVGAGRVIAKVHAELNPRKIETVEEVVDPDKTAIKSSVVEEEKLDGSRTNPTGVPGARSNLPGADENGQVGFQQNVKKELKTTNYSVPKTVKNIHEQAGAIEKISVAVLVDGIVTTEKNEKGELIEKYTARSPEDLQRYTQIVKNALGVDDKRGDSVTVENIAFQKEDFSQVDEQMTRLNRERFMEYVIKWFLLLTIFFLGFFVVIRPFMRWITDSFQDSVEDILPRTIEELEELQSVDNTLPGMSGALPILEESLDPNKAESELLRERIMALIEKDEEKASGAFSLWLVRKDT